MRTIRIKTCNDIVEASLIKGRLKNEGIPSFITNQHFSTLLPNYNHLLGAGISLFVFENDFEKAALVLHEVNPSTSLHCPHCGSSKIYPEFGKTMIKKLVIVFISIMALLPFSNLKTKYHCISCGENF